MTRLTSEELGLKATEGPYEMQVDDTGAHGVVSAKTGEFITFAFPNGDPGSEVKPERFSWPEMRATANLLAASWDLYRALEMQIRNCPVCKGDGMAVDMLEFMTRGDRETKIVCTRCLPGRQALFKAQGRIYVAEEVSS